MSFSRILPETTQSPASSALRDRRLGEQRLEALQGTGLLDTPPEPIFDRLAELVRKMLRVPVALVSLVDENRQFFKSALGLPEPWSEKRETPLTHSFCQHVASSAAPLIISDARQNPIVRDNRAIGELGVVAYLGVPLLAPEGHAIGSLCAIDGQPRQWLHEDLEVLQTLAEAVMAEIALRAHLRERERAAELVQQSEAKFRTLADSMSQFAWLADAKGSIHWYNQRWFDYTGAAFEEMKGWGWTAVHHPDHIDRVVKKLQHSWDTGEPWEDEFPLRGKDGEYRWFLSRALALRDAAGRVTGWVGTNTDITAQRETEASLQEAKEAAERANHAKDNFLAVLSHELRTPLTPVLMCVAAMDSDPELPPEIRGNVEMIRRNVELEIKLIDDLLDLNRIVSGKLRLELRQVDLNAAVDHVCQICRPALLEKAIRVHRQLDEAVGYATADPARLQQVLWNVLKNAAKFTPERGDVFITTSLVSSQRVRLQIRDTGRGIAPDMLGRVFEAFEQGDDKITRQFGGMGLGLAISKAIVELHGGSIHAASEGIGAGATFAIELPGGARKMAKGSLDPEPPPRTAAGKNLRLLLVEDHADTARVLGFLLQACGYAVQVTGTVAGAIKAAETEPFDLVLSDVGLPDATGYDLMRELKQRFRMKGIAMSGYGMDEDIRKGRDAGFSEHLVKPVSLTQLRQAINRVASSEAPV